MKPTKFSTMENPIEVEDSDEEFFFKKLPCTQPLSKFSEKTTCIEIEDDVVPVVPPKKINTYEIDENPANIKKPVKMSIADEKLITRIKKRLAKRRREKGSHSPSPADGEMAFKFNNWVHYEPVTTGKFKNVEEKFKRLAEKLADYRHEEMVKFWETPEAKEITEENRFFIGYIVSYIIKQRAIRTTLRCLENKNKKRVYNYNQMKKFVELVNQYEEKYKLRECKDILRANQQTVTGNKPELIERIADGEVLGKIPKCHCGGKLAFHYDTGMYQCPGTRKDGQYVFCNRIFPFQCIKRAPWK